jgi:acyl-coenzyme A synthetase/AMP-(fatty) acid ligase
MPKGVTISHSAAAAFVDWTAREFHLGPDDRLACPSPLSFDLSTFDVLNIARSGSACVLLPEPTRWVPRLLFQAIAELGVTVWYSVPSALAAVSDTPELVRDRLACVRTFLLAGEVFPPRLAVALRAARPRARILNLYGPTETNVVTWYELPADIDPERPVPIGTACPYAVISIEQDAYAAGDRAARGGEAMTGELLLAGRSTMLGYWNREADTARAFVESGEGTSRVRYYRSGDRVSMFPGGQLHYLGRTDRQIKRRGIRIEPEEIEHVLGRHGSVAEAAVVATADSPPVVSAFVRLAPGMPATADDLQRHCATLLPSSMLPDRIVILAAMPRGSRGKVDYEKLLSRQPGDRECG